MSKVECIDCAALPIHGAALRARGGYALDVNFRPGVDYRPPTPRPIDSRSTPRRPRCTTHWRIADKARRQDDSDARSRKRAGVDEKTRQLVLAEQGGRCPCGAGLGGKRLNLSADHEHDLARLHDHPEDVACLECLAGFLCHHCNREIIGYLARAGRTGSVSRTRAEVAGALESLAVYLRHPPAARVRARRLRSA